MAPTLCTADVAHTISQRTGTVMHGPTFMGNPLACAVALASLDLLDDERLARAAPFDGVLERYLGGLRRLAHVANVRTLGAIGVVELTHDVDVAAPTQAALDAGVWIRPFCRLIYTMPPYPCTDDDQAAIASDITAAVQACTPSNAQAGGVRA